MTYDEFIDEFFELIEAVPDEADESVLVTGFLNEQMALNDFRVPLEELMVILKFRRPAIAAYLDLIGSRDFKRLFRSELTLEQALEKIGKGKKYFEN